jgi:DNA-binding GntR family transcriptional regulator
MTIEDPRRYVRAMCYIKARIEDGTFKLHELMPSIGELADQTGHSRHTIGKALRILQDQGLVDRTPGLGYTAKARTAATSDPRPVMAANGHASSPAGWGLGGATRGHR